MKLDFDAIVIGAGIAGLYQLYKLREIGMKVRVFEEGKGVGGTGIGIDILELGLTQRVFPMLILFQKNCWMSGIGRNILHHNLKF